MQNQVELWAIWSAVSWEGMASLVAALALLLAVRSTTAAHEERRLAHLTRIQVVSNRLDGLAFLLTKANYDPGGLDIHRTRKAIEPLQRMLERADEFNLPSPTAVEGYVQACIGLDELTASIEAGHDPLQPDWQRAQHTLQRSQRAMWAEIRRLRGRIDDSASFAGLAVYGRRFRKLVGGIAWCCDEVADAILARANDDKSVVTAFKLRLSYRSIVENFARMTHFQKIVLEAGGVSQMRTIENLLRESAVVMGPSDAELPALADQFRHLAKDLRTAQRYLTPLNAARRARRFHGRTWPWRHDREWY